jgi:hypothetical protein
LLHDAVCKQRMIPVASGRYDETRYRHGTPHRLACEQMQHLHAGLGAAAVGPNGHRTACNVRQLTDVRQGHRTRRSGPCRRRYGRAPRGPNMLSKHTAGGCGGGQCAADAGGCGGSQCAADAGGCGGSQCAADAGGCGGSQCAADAGGCGLSHVAAQHALSACRWAAAAAAARRTSISLALTIREDSTVDERSST